MMQYSKPRAPKIKSQCIRLQSVHLAVGRVTPSCGIQVDAVHSALHARDPRACIRCCRPVDPRTLCQDGRPSNYCAICQPRDNLSQVRLSDAAKALGEER